MFPPDTLIVVVDDYRTMRRVLTHTLEAHEFTNVKECEDGLKAWVLIEDQARMQKPVGLIISDWNMPVLSGIELLKRVRSNPLTKDTPFLMVTGAAEEMQIAAALELKVDGYIIKPLSSAILMQKIKEIHQRVSSS